MTSEQIAAYQAQQDENRKMIELSIDYENKLKQEIIDSTPFISDLMDLGVLKEEYRENKFENCFDMLYTRYK
jgi:hypothetical protein